jgi:hypothetical protein
MATAVAAATAFFKYRRKMFFFLWEITIQISLKYGATDNSITGCHMMPF